jgi:hypothetical protein
MTAIARPIDIAVSRLDGGLGSQSRPSRAPTVYQSAQRASNRLEWGKTGNGGERISGAPGPGAPRGLRDKGEGTGSRMINSNSKGTLLRHASPAQTQNIGDQVVSLRSAEDQVRHRGVWRLQEHTQRGLRRRGHRGNRREGRRRGMRAVGAMALRAVRAGQSLSGGRVAELLGRNG